MTDDELIASVMRKAMADPLGCVLIEDGMVLLDTSWVRVSPEEEAALVRAKDAAEGEG